jgi:[histone H3]-lysine4 N-trimethyltransferase SETD1
VFHDPYGEECKNLVESLTTEKKVVPIVPVIVAPPLNVDVPKVSIDFQDFVTTKPVEPVEERPWAGGSKYRDKDWESTSYSRSSSKYDEEYSSRSSSKYYDRKDRDRDYKYGHHSSRDDYERDRHKRDREKDRRGDYRSKDEWKERDRSSRKDREYFEYKDNHRGYRDYSSKRSSTRDPSVEHAEYSSYTGSSGATNSYGYNYPYPSGSSTGWAPPPPKGLPEDSPPRPPPEPPNDDAKEPKHKLSTEDGEATVDLDTRIAMLFKSKSFGGDASFQLDEDSDKDAKHEDGEVKEAMSVDESAKNDIDMKKLKIDDEFDGVEDGELTEVKHADDSSISTVPSPYESRNTFRVNRKFCKSRKRKRNEEKVKVESGASDISSSEDELLAKGSYSPPLPPKNDEMSLSSLSSTEPIKEEVVDMKDFDPASCMYPVGFSSYNAAYYYQNSFHQFQQPSSWMASAYKKEHQGSNDPHEVAVKKVIDKLILELKQILKKDFNKRMIENTAFKKYEAWWDEQERNKNTRSYQPEVKEATVTAATVTPSEAVPVLDQYQQAGGLGILRNLRFQRIKREPAPIQQEEDSRKSDQDDDDMVHGSDSEKEDIQQTSKTSYIKQTVSALSSSESSESSDSSSDDDEEEEERDDHAYSSDTASIMSDDELTVRKTPLKKEKENNRIYSDSESDLDELPEVPAAKTTPSKVKPKIYSDTEDEEEPPPPGTSSEVEPEKKREKTPEVRPPAESDSDFFNEDVMSKPPRTPGRISSDDQVEKEPEKKPPKASNDDRMYSDSEEEREYQEKIRRNTEWMEQIEREAKEEMEKQRQLKAQQKDEMPSTDTSRAPSPETTTPKLPPKTSSFDEPLTPTTSLPPPTPGAHIKSESLTNSSKLDLDAGKKKRGRPKGSVGKPKEPKKVKNGKIDVSTFAQPHPSSKPEVEQKYSLKMSPYSSSDGGSSHASLVAQEHCYSLPPSASPSLSSSPHDIHMDHDYCGKTDVQPLQSIQPGQLEEQNKKEQTMGPARPVGRPRKDPNAPKAQYTKKDKSGGAAAAAAVVAVEKQKPPKEKIKKIDLKEHQTMVENFVPVSRYEKRTNNEEFEILCKFLTKGIDEEDVTYMRRAYSYLIQNDIPGTELLHQVHWVDHCSTDRTFEPSAPKKRKRDNNLPEMKHHTTGCARTEGFYKIDSRCKAAYKYHHLKGTVAGSHLDNTARMAVAKMQNASREARSNQRRLLTAFGGATESDLLKFNQLKFRKKQLKFAKSAIHDWGLFAMEPIAADEMVIEYVGQMVRPSVADTRETKYEAIGIGSSYLFRIDHETIIDATKCGNLARFINHSCNVSLSYHIVTLNLTFGSSFSSPTATQKSSQSSRRRKLSSTRGSR